MAERVAVLRSTHQSQDGRLAIIQRYRELSGAESSRLAAVMID